MDNNTTIEKVSDTEYVRTRKSTVVVREQTNLIETKQRIQFLKNELAMFEEDFNKRIGIKREFYNGQIATLEAEITQAESLGVKEPEPLPSDPSPVDTGASDSSSEINP